MLCARTSMRCAPEEASVLEVEQSLKARLSKARTVGYGDVVARQAVVGVADERAIQVDADPGQFRAVGAAAVDRPADNVVRAVERRSIRRQVDCALECTRLTPSHANVAARRMGDQQGEQGGGQDAEYQPRCPVHCGLVAPPTCTIRYGCESPERKAVTSAPDAPSGSGGSTNAYCAPGCRLTRRCVKRGCRRR